MIKQVSGGQNKLIINAAITGMIPQKHHTPHIPISVDEIVYDAISCHAAGASMIHIHARNSDGTPAWDPKLYGEIIEGIRETCPDLIICASTSGRNFPELEKRSAVLMLEGRQKPDFASLTLGSMNFPKQASVNQPDIIKSLAKIMNEQGIRPELEIFDLGMLDFAQFLISEGLLKGPHFFNLFLGSLGTLAANPLNLTCLLNALPVDAHWGATGIGRFQTCVNNMAVSMGGHVRVGLEDNIWFDANKKQLATNEMLVKRVVGVANAMDREIATPAEVRHLLGLDSPLKSISSITSKEIEMTMCA